MTTANCEVFFADVENKIESTFESTLNSSKTLLFCILYYVNSSTFRKRTIQ